MILWKQAIALKDCCNTDAHKKAMPKLQHWCDEASVAHWQKESVDFPTWKESYKRMRTHGRVSKVKHPSPNHLLREVTPPHYPSKTERILLPKK